MKAILEFNLPEEAYQLELATKADELASTIRLIDGMCRREIKHGTDHKTPIEVMEWVRREINEVRHIIEA